MTERVKLNHCLKLQIDFERKSLEITPKALKARLETFEPLFLLDVRDTDEFQFTNIGGTLIPLAELEHRVSELESVKDKEIVVICHHGIRSRHAAHFLRGQGFTKVLNLSGGIDRYSYEADPTIKRY